MAASPVARPRGLRHAGIEKPWRLGLNPQACGACLAGIVLQALVPVSGQAQVLQQWTHKATFGDASAVVAMDNISMFVAINEDEVLRLYARYPDTACTVPVYSVDMRPRLRFSSTNPGADLESGAKLTDANGTRIYWLGGLDNSKTGNLRPNRNRIFATQVSGNGSGSPPYSLSYVGRYDFLRDDLIAWDKNNLHGKGANYFGLEASAAAGVSPTGVNGFNIEGLVMAPNGTTAYIGFRTPLVNGFGPTTTLESRSHALLVPLLNMPALVVGDSTPGPGTAQFGAPITLDLGRRGVRSIDSSSPGQYLITSGPPGDASNPPVAPNNFRLFTWSGVPNTAVYERATDFPYSLSPEGATLPAGAITNQTIVQFVSDDGGGNGCWHSFTTYVGAQILTAVPPEPGRLGGSWFSRPLVPNPAHEGVTFAITVPREQWVDLSVSDLQGRRLATLWRGVLSQGEHGFSWSARSLNAPSERAGLYWVRLRTGGSSEARLFALIR